MERIIEGFPNEKLYNFRRQNITIIEDPVTVVDIGYFPNAKNHYVNREMGCDSNIIGFCTRGKGYIETKGMRYVVNSNTMFILPKNIRHKYFSFEQDGWSIYFVHIKGETAERYVTHWMSSSVVKKIESNLLLNMINLIFFQSLVALDTNTSGTNVHYVNESIHYLLKSLIISEKLLLVDKNEENFARFLNYVDINIGETITMSKLTSNLNMSQSNLHRLTIEKVNQSPIEYIKQYKLNQAAILLRTTDDTIRKIALKLGYIDPYHFSRVFKNQLWSVTQKLSKWLI